MSAVEKDWWECSYGSGVYRHPKKNGFLVGCISVIWKIRKACYIILDVLVEEGHYIICISSPEWSQTVQKTIKMQSLYLFSKDNQKTKIQGLWHLVAALWNISPLRRKCQKILFGVASFCFFSVSALLPVMLSTEKLFVAIKQFFTFYMNLLSFLELLFSLVYCFLVELK